MLKIIKIESEAELEKEMPREKFIDFLYTHLDKFGDTKSAISKCIDYAFAKDGKPGGFLLTAYYDGELCGELVLNKTGMSEYIPDNILVYIAERCINEAEGDVKLHVEYDNPAKRLYERIGFTTKYAEMRYKK